MKKLIGLIAIIAACGTSDAVRHTVQPQPAQQTTQAPQRIEEMHWWGYRISYGNLRYEHNTRNYECTLWLGNDARIKDTYCNGHVDMIEDDQGFLSCFYEQGSSRCDLAEQILTKKKRELNVDETHQRWVETGGDDVLREYL